MNARTTTATSTLFLAIPLALLVVACDSGGGGEEPGGAEEIICGDIIESAEEECTLAAAKAELAEEGGCVASFEEKPENLDEFAAYGYDLCP